jgi:hypothetical protein
VISGAAALQPGSKSRDRPLSGELAPPPLNEPLAFREVVNNAVTNRDISLERGLRTLAAAPY